MRVGTPGFIPARLVEARAARRIKTQKQLADMLGTVASTVSRWEKGEFSPDADALSALSEVLKVRREYFLRPFPTSVRPSFHRQLSTTLAADLRYQESQMSWLQELSSTLNHYVDFPPLDIPDVLQGASWKQLRDDDIEQIAIDLRSHWRLGNGPCVDIVQLLERVGIIVGTIEMGTSKLDGLCSWSAIDDRPHILLATDKMSFPRRQMDGAHELAHVILHREVTPEEFKDNIKEIEMQAFRLASAFLMPSNSYPYELKRASLANFLLLKERWRVSIKAQIHRVAGLGLIPREYMTDLYKLYSARGWTKAEPLDSEWDLTNPTLMKDALNLIVESGTRTKQDLLSVEFVISDNDLENLCSTEEKWFSQKEGQLIQLKIKAPERKNSTSTVGEIIPFKRN
ncbi:XRE family transcriptional regulator [Ochrobactrum sp. BD67]